MVQSKRSTERSQRASELLTFFTSFSQPRWLLRKQGKVALGEGRPPRFQGCLALSRFFLNNKQRSPPTVENCKFCTEIDFQRIVTREQGIDWMHQETGLTRWMRENRPKRTRNESVRGKQGRGLSRVTDGTAVPPCRELATLSFVGFAFVKCGMWLYAGYFGVRQLISNDR